MKKILAKNNGFTLCKKNDLYFIEELATDYLNMTGNKEELIKELKRWSIEVDSDNNFMKSMELSFINVLEGGI